MTEKHAGPSNFWRVLTECDDLSIQHNKETQRNSKSDVKQLVQGPRFKLGRVAVVDPMHFRVVEN